MRYWSEGRRKDIENYLCVTVLCTIIMVHNGTSSSYRWVGCIGLRVRWGGNLYMKYSSWCGWEPRWEARTNGLRQHAWLHQLTHVHVLQWLCMVADSSRATRLVSELSSVLALTTTTTHALSLLPLYYTRTDLQKVPFHYHVDLTITRTGRWTPQSAL